jgi:hypothetical protein
MNHIFEHIYHHQNLQVLENYNYANYHLILYLIHCHTELFWQLLVREISCYYQISQIVFYSLVYNHMFFSDTETITLSAVRRIINKVGVDFMVELVDVLGDDLCFGYVVCYVLGGLKGVGEKVME